MTFISCHGETNSTSVIQDRTYNERCRHQISNDLRYLMDSDLRSNLRHSHVVFLRPFTLA
jgi:hypothetical protein